MPRLSLWKSEKSNDYRFFDRTISEMFSVGATDLYIHKYIGTNNPSNITDISQPKYDKLDPTNIQDLLFLENRDRKYDNNIYRLRGHYNVQNLDFDLSQFGLFLSNDVIFVTVHYNDMINVIGRKLMVGDVFELPHLTDYHPLNETIPIGLRRYYQITDANFASEGFSSSWYPHLWRIKCEPLIDSQEFANILSKPISKDNHLGDWDKSKGYPEGYTVSDGGKVYISLKEVPADTDISNSEYWKVSTEGTLADILTTYNSNIEINNLNLAEASRLVPKSGYDTSELYIIPKTDTNELGTAVDYIINTTVSPAPTYIDVITNANYKNSSTVLRIPKDSEIINTLSLKVGLGILLSQTQIAPTMTSGGSGAMVNEPGLTVTAINSSIQNPYSTADNILIQADQSASIILTTYAATPKTNTLYLVDIPQTVVLGMKVKCIVFSEYGSPESSFNDDTIITDINPIEKTITVSNVSNTSIPEGQTVEVAHDFNGSISQDTNYQADSDPRFKFIKRFTPKSFGYAMGYMSGTGEAPNGESVKAGTAFPANPQPGDYFLRLDYLPQKLYRWNGKLWVGISNKVRTEIGLIPGDESLRSSFINNTNTIKNALGDEVSARQSLSKALRIKPD